MAKREQIYTIPVNDAFNQKRICPLCYLKNTRTEQLVEYYLGPSLMESDNRLETNKKGFCNDHFTDLYNSQDNRLGFGLMTHTHLLEQKSNVERNFSKAKPTASKGLFSKSDWKDNLRSSANKFRELADSCALCDRLNNTMVNYIDVIFYEFSTDSSFMKKFDDIAPICIPHVADLLDEATSHLKEKEAIDFINVLERVENEKMAGLTSEIEWFTQKFDYRNKDKPWGDSRTSLPRSINFLSGFADMNREDNDD